MSITLHTLTYYTNYLSCLCDCNDRIVASWLVEGNIFELKDEITRWELQARNAKRALSSAQYRGTAEKLVMSAKADWTRRKQSG